jgi:hypothetical protein
MFAHLFLDLFELLGVASAAWVGLIVTEFDVKGLMCVVVARPAMTDFIVGLIHVALVTSWGIVL